MKRLLSWLIPIKPITSLTTKHLYLKSGQRLGEVRIPAGHTVFLPPGKYREVLTVSDNNIIFESCTFFTEEA